MLQLLPFTPGKPITAPGLYAIGEADYHADRVCETPSLSSSLVRTIVNASPLHAWTDHPRLNVVEADEDDDTASKTMDMGSAVHAMLLGSGRDIEVLHFKDFKTNAAKAARDEARAAGKTPLLAKAFKQADKLVALIHRQIAKFEELPDLLGPGTIFEHAAVWQDNGIWCRALMDIIRVYPGFIAIVDFKSTERSAAPAVIGRQVFSMGYDVQLAFYRRGLQKLIGAGCPPIRCFIMSQERGGPGALSIVELDNEVLTLADKKAAAGMGMWKTCLERDEWPAYPPFVGTVTLPPWAETAWLEREVNDDALAGAGYGFAMPIPERGSDTPADVLRAG